MPCGYVNSPLEFLCETKKGYINQSYNTEILKLAVVRFSSPITFRA